MAQVVLDRISKVYPGDVKAVDAISLTIPDGRFVVLVGPSGCGKSTTLRMVAGLEEITDGTISIGDKVVNDVPPKNRDIAMVFQNYALYPHMSVYKNMAFGLKLRGFPKPEIDRRVREASTILGLDDYLERKPKALSGGQRQRVAVGRAIVRDPACFLFDEPLSNLDAKLRVEMRAELKRLHHRLQTTTLYVTHDQEEAMTLGDLVVVMDGGIIQQADGPLNVYHFPANRFVAGFLGMPPMNFLDGKLSQDDSGTWFVGDAGKVKLTAEQAERVSGHIGQPVVFGVRPESLHLRASDKATNPDQQLNGTLNVVEPLGSAMDLFVMLPNDQRLVARVTAERMEADDQEVTLKIDMSGVHIFEPGIHGENLTLAATKPAALATG
ncbi:MAG: sn-glycerol-3-phosphate ABC transporter ATP-binding protein UgpC [Phycisphaeraceae bacterium]